ncbi:MAG: TrkA family potassium uptake protein [Thermoguttaceae bacterium]
MAETKRFVVIGLGSFGTALATRLHKNDCRVTGLDLRKDRVEMLKNELYEAVIGDATEREVLEHLSLRESHAVFISLGENIARSLLATLHCKELGARRIIVKGVTKEHDKLLKHLGVERVVFPEIEVATELADRMTWPNILDFLPIDPDYSIVEIAVPESWSGQTLAEANLRRRYNVWVVGLKDVLSGKLEIFPDADFRLNSSQLLLVVGRQTDLNRLRELA